MNILPKEEEEEEARVRVGSLCQVYYIILIYYV